MVSKILFLFSCITTSILVVSCGTSVSTRYEQKPTLKENAAVKTKKYQQQENFDLSQYRTRLDLPKIKSTRPDVGNGLWYNYRNLPDTSKMKVVLNTSQGYRILVYTSDNLDEADSTKLNVATKTDRQDIYIVFDPPFYKVEVGDFRTTQDADNLNFQLKQMGFSDSRVISSKINIFK